MKMILVAEKKADDIEKRLTEHQEELSGIEKVNNIFHCFVILLTIHMYYQGACNG